MNEQQTGFLMQERRPGAVNRANELQRKHPDWSWLKCCTKAKLEWDLARGPGVSQNAELCGGTSATNAVLNGEL